MNNFPVQFYDRVVYVVAVVFLLSLAYSEALKSISLVLMLALLSYAVATNIVTISKDKVNSIIGLHVLFVVMGIWLGVNSEESLKQFSDVLKIILVFLFFREMNLYYFKRSYLYAFILIGFSLAVFPEFLSYNEVTHDYIKLRSVGSVNRSATYAVYIFVLSLYFFKYSEKTFFKFIGGFLIFLSLIAIILGGSRMAMFSLPMITFAYFSLQRGVKIKDMLLWVILFSFLWLTMYLVFPEARSFSRFDQGFEDMGRIQIWISSINIWIQNNILFGIGIGNSVLFSTVDFFGNNAVESKIDNAHNLYLDILLERGILGLITFLMFIKHLFFKTELEDIILIRVLIFSLLLMGLANITFRYEFALLFMSIAGISMNKFLKY